MFINYLRCTCNEYSSLDSPGIATMQRDCKAYSFSLSSLSKLSVLVKMYALRYWKQRMPTMEHERVPRQKESQVCNTKLCTVKWACCLCFVTAVTDSPTVGLSSSGGDAGRHSSPQSAHPYSFQHGWAAGGPTRARPNSTYSESHQHPRAGSGSCSRRHHDFAIAKSTR